MTTELKPMKPLTDWQKIFLQSKANGTDNCQDLLPASGWQFPKSTWFQARLERVRKEQGRENER